MAEAKSALEEKAVEVRQKEEALGEAHDQME